MSGSLAGRVALVTGAVRGIGLAAAHSMAEKGAKVWIADLKAEDDDAVSQALGSVPGGG